MGDVVGSIAGIAIEGLLQYLISLCAEEISLIRNIKKDLEKLKKSLIMIQAFLNDAEKQQVTNEAAKRWLYNLEAVAFDADNVLDELNYEVLRKKMETRNELKKKATDFGLQKHVGAHAPSLGSERLVERETDSYSVDPIVFGRENIVSRIVEILTCDSATHDEQLVFSVLPIVGMGGLGKTTLARLVFHDKKIETHFEKRIWVYVSKSFDTNDLFKKILESITGQKVDFDTRDALLRNLKANLEAKKYLLVLDDVWTEEMKKWGDFIDTLANISPVKGNGIIVTTRSEKVASIVGTVHIPKLSNLSDEDCWSIIKEKAFKKGCYIPLEFETIGKKIAKRCQGLPLAAKVVGGVLYGKSEEEWHSIEETRLSSFGEDEDTVRMILKLSFDNLSSKSLKKCFAFCSIFPKGFRIERKMLIYLWMSEGFLLLDQGNDVESVGDKYFDLLLQNSLLQVGESKWQGYNMHDLVHDVSCSVLNETSPVRYIYVKSIMDISKKDARNLRSLIFEGKYSNNMFSYLKCLRGLVLIGDDNKELPKVGDLIHLRYIDTSATRIECLPMSIGNLYHLQTLRTSNALKELPETLRKLINLRHLHILKSKLSVEHEANRLEEIPTLGHLPHLKSLYLEDLPNVRSIGSLLDGIHYNGVGEDTVVVFPALKKLKLSLMSSMTELLTTGESQLGREVVVFPRLEQLKLYKCRKLTSSGPSHFPCLKELEIDGMDTSLFLDNLLVNLTSLRELAIIDVEGLVCFPDVFFCNNQNLSFLSIIRCQNLTRLTPSFGASLRELGIVNCEKLEELPEDLLCLDSLVAIRIMSCPKLKSIPYNPRGEGHESVQSFTSFRRLTIVDCGLLTELPIGMLESCTPSLETVFLDGLESLTNMAMVVGCLQKMPHLTRLSLDFKRIPELANNSFPMEIGSFHSLRELIISCGMENWERVEEQLQHLTALRSLTLVELEIEAIPEWLEKLPFLEELNLVKCTNLRSLPSKEAMKRLTRLKIVDCPRLNMEKDDHHSEWHKISHATNVRVFG